jgi:tetrahydromethanopterin S-methyltransferase subunit D
MNKLIWLAGAVLAMGMVIGCGPEPAPVAAPTSADSGGIPAGTKKSEAGAGAEGAQAADAMPAPDWAKTGTPTG